MVATPPAALGDPGIDPLTDPSGTRAVSQSVVALLLSQTVRTVAGTLLGVCAVVILCAHCARQCMDSAQRSARHMRYAYERFEYRGMEQSRRLLNARSGAWT